jgi:sulfur-oxidizing protein SoxB
MSRSRYLTIFQMNDSHGYLEMHPELYWSGDHAKYRMAGGYARIASLIDAESEDRTLAFDCGDTFHGTYLPVQTEGRAMLPVLNALGFAAMTAHWEFAYGPKQFMSLAGELKYPVLAINCYQKSSGDLAFPPSIIIEKNGLSVGVIGIASNIVDKTMPPSYSEGLRFTLGREELSEQINLLHRDRADLIIVISHLGFPQDARLASEVEGVDIWLSGHTHNRLYEPAYINGTAMIQSGCHGSFLGRLDLEVDCERVNVSHRLMVVRQEINPHSQVEEMINRSLGPHRQTLETIVGKTETALNRNTILEGTMDNFLLQSLLDASGSKVAFSNGWRYGAPVPSGPVNMNDLYNIIPMNPPISLVNLTGREIWNMMEENLELTFSRDPYNQMGGYVKRCLGLNIYFKMENPLGTRIQELFVQGRRLKPDEVYSAAFLTQQAVPPKYGHDRKEADVRAVDAMEAFLAKGPVSAELKGSVVAV